MKEEKKESKISRRALLKLGAGAFAASSLLPGISMGNQLPSQVKPLISGPGHIVKVHMPGMRVGAFPNPQASKIMLEKAMLKFTNEADMISAWYRFIETTDVVGIKINCLGGKMASSMKEIVDAICDSLMEAGIPQSNIIIFDMSANHLKTARFNLQKSKKNIRVLAHRDSPYEKTTRTSGPAKVNFSKLFLDCDSIINVPPIKDHGLSGVTCCMKNITFGVVQRPQINHHVCNEAIAYLWALEEIKKRVKINIIDGSTILYDGGPTYNRSAHVPHESLYVTTDPVAMDAIAYELIDELRKENGLRPLKEVNKYPSFIDLSEKIGLGIATRSKIKLETITLPKFIGKTV